MILLIVSLITILIGTGLSFYYFKRKKEEKISTVLHIVGCIGLFLVIVNAVIINMIPPTEIKETTYELVKYSNDSLFDKKGDDYYVKVKINESNEKEISLVENCLVNENNESAPFIIEKEHIYPEYFKLFFMKEFYPKTYEIHI